MDPSIPCGLKSSFGAMPEEIFSLYNNHLNHRQRTRQRLIASLCDNGLSIAFTDERGPKCGAFKRRSIRKIAREFRFCCLRSDGNQVARE
jgi:hypothetical protein